MIGDLVVLLQRYDDDAWAALASRGLLRRARKDLESTTPTLTSEEPVVVTVGPHQVRFPGPGPDTATCTCPSPTICQHVVAAGLWLASSLPTDAVSSAASAHDELMAMDTAALAAHAGRAGLRWALQLLADLDPESVQVSSGPPVVIAFRTPRVTFRFAGGGPGALVPDTRLGSPAKYAVAAALAYQRAHGAPLPDLGTETRRAHPARGSQAQSGERLLRAVDGLLLDTARLGVSHLSPAIHQRYESLAVWAQGAELHRLARLLRRLSDHVELLLERSARADEHAMLEEVAIAYALLGALRAAGDPPPRRLAGRARTSYTPVGTMTLIGLGGLPWHAASGYHGLTCLFWWPEEQRFVSWTDARPDTVVGFSPRARWNQPGPWAGLGSPAQSTGRHLTLRDAELSVGGRLSGTERTRASFADGDADVDVDAAALPVCDDWSSLDLPARSLLDDPDPLAAWVVLRPAAVAPAVFDEVRQTLWWTVYDASGTPLPMALPWTILNVHAVERLESLTTAEAEGSLVVARLTSRDGRLVGEPLSLLHEGAVDCLHFDGVPGSQRRHPEAAAVPEQPAGASATALPAPVASLRWWTLQQLERGTGAVPPASVLAGLDERHRAARDAGFAIFGAIERGGDPAPALLRSHYAGLQLAAVLGTTGHGDRSPAW